MWKFNVKKHKHSVTYLHLLWERVKHYKNFFYYYYWQSITLLLLIARRWWCARRVPTATWLWRLKYLQCVHLNLSLPNTCCLRIFLLCFFLCSRFSASERFKLFFPRVRFYFYPIFGSFNLSRFLIWFVRVHSMRCQLHFFVDRLELESRWSKWFLSREKRKTKDVNHRRKRLLWL